jgi:cell division septal protein FtsQ
VNKYLIRRIVLGSIALFLILQAFNFMGHLPLFKIREIEVAGNQFLSKDDVLQNLEIPADASWLWISGTKMFRKLKTLPQIKECQIKKKISRENFGVDSRVQAAFSGAYRRTRLDFCR